MDLVQLRDLVIVPTLDYLGMNSKAAVNLLLGTCAHESKSGEYIAQIKGPAQGVYQIEPNTERDVFENFLKYKTDLRDKVDAITALKINNLISNLSYQTAIARIVYYRRPEPLPSYDDVEALAQYWKDHYNTRLGDGLPEQFIESYPHDAALS